MKHQVEITNFKSKEPEFIEAKGSPPMRVYGRSHDAPHGGLPNFAPPLWLPLIALAVSILALILALTS